MPAALIPWKITFEFSYETVIERWILTARGEIPAAFGRRCIPPPPQRGCRVGGPGAGGVAPPSNTPSIIARRALPAAHAMPSRCTTSETGSIRQVLARPPLALSISRGGACPRTAPSEPPHRAKSARRGPRGARRKALVTADASAPGGAAPPTRQPRCVAEAAPFAATRERLM